MKENSIIFGGSGFMGSHLADELSKAGHSVIVFDMQKSEWLKPEQKMVLGDLLDKEKLVQVLKENKINNVFHLAGIADIDECDREPVKAIKYNVLGTAMLLDACVETKVSKFLFASSAYVESDKGSFYRVSKQACEGLVEEYSKKFGLEYVILRYGSLYGPRSDARNSLHRLVSQALQSGSIVYNGSGEERREFIHVLDAAKLSVKVISPEYANKKILITGSQTIQYKELLDMIGEMCGDKVKISYNPKLATSHYRVSPYAYKPDIVHKLVSNYHIDFGQGLLSLIYELGHKD